MNKAILVGRLTADIELKVTHNNKSVCSFQLAINRRFNQEKTDFISCIAWGKTAEVICQYTQKGDRLGVVGSIETRNWTDSDGVKRYATEVNVGELYLMSAKRKENQKAIGDFPPGSASDFEEDLPVN